MNTKTRLRGTVATEHLRDGSYYVTGYTKESMQRCGLSDSAEALKNFKKNSDRNSNKKEELIGF